MRPPLRLVASFMVSVSVSAAGTLDASAQERHPGWLVETVRLEPLGHPDSAFAIDGLDRYRGIVELRAGRGGVAVINEVAVEDYVKGIVEVPPTWPIEALKAQAIAARTYALNQRASTVATSWREVGADLCATQACQVYLGLAAEERENNEAWVRAVDATAGQVLLRGGQPILAEYSSSNGGRSIAGSASYLRSVNDPDDANSPLSSWRYAVPLAQLAPFSGVQTKDPLVAVARAADSIVWTFKPPDAEPVEVPTPATDFLAAASGQLPIPPGLPSPFPSSRFDLRTEGGEVIIEGRGWGHGRGMSQWGAYGKARRGMSAPDILAAYYGGTRPTSLAGDQAPAPLRVALATDRRSVAVSGSQLFRVLASDGTVLATVALGRWAVGLEKGKLRVSPPAGYGEPMTVSAGELTSSDLTAGDAPSIRFTLSAPAVVTVRVQGPGVDAVPLSGQLVEAGEASVALPAAPLGGSYDVLIQAEAGPDRRAEARLRFDVVGQTVYEASLAAVPATRPRTVAVAFLLAAAAALGCAVARRTTPAATTTPA